MTQKVIIEVDPTARTVTVNGQPSGDICCLQRYFERLGMAQATIKGDDAFPGLEVALGADGAKLSFAEKSTPALIPKVTPAPLPPLTLSMRQLDDEQVDEPLEPVDLAKARADINRYFGVDDDGCD